MTTDVHPPVINLSAAPGARSAWNRSTPYLAAWLLVEFLLVTNPLQISSRLRTAALRRFGAQIGQNVILRPRIRVKFPWMLSIGDRSWVGEGVWIHNQDTVRIGSDVVISQETFITTGSHRHRVDMGLVTSGVIIEDGAWMTTRCIVLGGSRVGRSALARPLTVVSGVVPSNAIVSGPDCRVIGPRFPKYPLGVVDQ